MSEAVETRPRRKALWLVLIGLSLAALIFGVLMRDEAPTDASALQSPDVPRSENAYFALAPLGEALSVENDALSALIMWAMEDEPFPRKRVVRVLAKQEAAFDRAIAACRAGRIQVPLDVEAETAAEPFLWLELRARLRAEEGQVEAALGDALISLEAGEAFRSDARSVDTWLEGQRVTEIGAQALNEVLRRVKLGEEGLLAIDKRLAELAALPDGLARAQRGEGAAALRLFEGSKGRAEAAAAMDELLPFGEGLAALADTVLWRLVYKPERTRRRIIEHFTASAEAIADPGRSAPGFIVEELGAFEEMMSGNLVGRRFLREVVELEDLEDLRQARRRPELVHEALRARIALARFRQAEGRLPAALSALCPRYLKAVPEDLDGKPLRYSAALEILYSVWDDGEDDVAVTGNPKDENDMIFSLKRIAGP